jgi:hypothetical protein
MTASRTAGETATKASRVAALRSRQATGGGVALMAMGDVMGQPEAGPQAPGVSALKRLLLLSATSLAAVNIWTGAPLLALWVGSRIVGQRALTMGSVLLVLVLLVLFVTATAFTLTWLSARYDDLVQRPSGEHRTSPWLRSMRGEQKDLARAKLGTTPVEWIVTTSTVIAVIGLEVWFFFFAGSPLPS